jgi:hypothetical protein
MGTGPILAGTQLLANSVEICGEDILAILAATNVRRFLATLAMEAR